GNGFAGVVLSTPSSSMTIVDSAIINNTGDYGGGISNYGTLTVINSTISGNSSGRSGGGIYNVGSTTLMNVTITNNTAGTGGVAGDGGGIVVASGSYSIKNSIIAGNFDVNGSPTNQYPDCKGPVTSQGHNLIGN